jgi:hypothetical protein
MQHKNTILCGAANAAPHFFCAVSDIFRIFVTHLLVLFVANYLCMK